MSRGGGFGKLVEGSLESIFTSAGASVARMQGRYALSVEAPFKVRLEIQKT